MSVALLIGMAVVRIATTLAIVKVLSVTFGPEAFGSLSHVIGISALFYMFAGGGVANGLIRNVAAESSSPGQYAWLAAASGISMASAFLLGAICIILAVWGGSNVMMDAELAPLFLVIGVSQLFVGFGNIAFAFLSGLGKIKAFSLANAIGSLVAAALVLAAVQVFGLQGAYIAVAILPLPPALLGIGVLVLDNAPRKLRDAPVEGKRVRDLIRFSIAMLVGVLSVPMVQAAMRVGMAEQSGLESVGQWQAVARISDAYMQVFGVLFINLVLPQLSRVTGDTRRALAARLAAGLILLFMAGSAVYYLLRDQVILFAFSPEFLPAADLVLTQSLGDLLKIAIWIVVYTYVAGGLVRVMIGAELVQAALTMLMFVILAPAAREAAAVQAHATACFITLVCLIGFALSESRLRWKATE